MSLNANEIYLQLKKGKTKYHEEIHCPLILDIMMDKKKGTHSYFCVEALIGDSKFYEWTEDHELFAYCYCLGKMFARKNWEEEGRIVKKIVTIKGQTNNRMEYWKMAGWSRFGISKNSRIRLNLKDDANPSQHYAQLLKQASQGDFTAGEIKQLMEAINVGLRAHELFELQKEIDQLKSDIEKINEGKNGENNYTAQGIAQKGKDSLANSLRKS